MSLEDVIPGMRITDDWFKPNYQKKYERLDEKPKAGNGKKGIIVDGKHYPSISSAAIANGWSKWVFYKLVEGEEREYKGKKIIYEY
jgi:hypothetical protein